jgi:hypothetical protein
MKSPYLILMSFILTSYTNADDGVFYASGNNLIPLEETNIELQKEILILDRQDACENSRNDQLFVNVYFEFYNPGTEVDKLVGFVTPPAEGHTDGLDVEHPQISNFSVTVNDVLISYNISHLDSTNFKSYAGNAKGQDFIYYFKVRFKKGINIVRHTYTYQGSSGIDWAMPGPHFDYRLTTGKTWANKRIDNFELYINMGENSYITVPASFGLGLNSEWKILGTRKVGRLCGNQSEARRIKINSGFLYFDAIDFQPDIDLTINTINPISDIVDNQDIYRNGWESKAQILSELSASDLRILRNSLYALHGFEFKSLDLLDYFSKYDWYMPDPNIKEEDIELGYWEHKLLDEIIAEEMNR